MRRTLIEATGCSTAVGDRRAILHCMNVREAIEALTAAAARTPLGLDTEFKVSLCDGSSLEESSEIEIDHFALISKETGEVNSWYVAVKGHPHRDREQGRTTRLQGIASLADEYLKKCPRTTRAARDRAASGRLLLQVQSQLPGVSKRVRLAESEKLSPKG
ncbi:MAG: hypothetical protein ABR608_03715 [Pseudonocardiaceae bacterium]